MRWQTPHPSPRADTISRSGNSVNPYTCVQVRIRSPSGLASGSSRGCAPVATKIMSAGKDCSPSAVSAITRSGPSSRPRPATRVTFSRSRRSSMSQDCLFARSSTRWLTASRSTRTRRRHPLDQGAKPHPQIGRLATSVMTSAVAIKVFEGTQSVRTAEPPRPSLSSQGDLATQLAGHQRCLVTARDLRPQSPPGSPHSRFFHLAGSGPTR